MHHAARCARPRRTCLLGQRQRIDIRTQRHSSRVSSRQRSENPRSTRKPSSKGDPSGTQLALNHATRSDFAVANLRICVEIAAKRHKCRQFLRDQFPQASAQLHAPHASEPRRTKQHRTASAVHRALGFDHHRGTATPQRQTIILFDEGCNLCFALTRFLIKRDRRAALRVIALTSAEAQRECAQIGHPVNASASPDSIIVVADGRALERSDAVLAIVAQLPLPWSLLRFARCIPRGLRDAIYRFVAKRRSRWFGRRGGCSVSKG